MTDDKGLTDEDMQLWYYVSQSVEPMCGKTPLELPDYAQEELFSDEEVTAEDLQTLIDKNQIKEKSKPQLDYIKHGVQSGVDKSTAKKLTGGKFNIDAKLDLHGKTQDEALLSLRYFIKNSFETSKRGVLVVTGKGSNNDGILKNQVPRWMNISGIREYIIMFSYAQPKHGGDGALYVLLKRRK
jgi:DNA-nicking Smr family endonuclease